MKLLLMSLFLVACSHGSFVTQNEEAADEKLNVYVDSVSVAKDKPSFVIVSGMKDVPMDDLRFQQYAEIAAKALKQAGFAQGSESSSHIIIKLSYSVSDARTHTDVSSGRHHRYVHGVGVVREQTIATDEYETFMRKVSLKAYDKRNKQVWATDIESEGSSNNLREVFPYMLAAGIQHFGHNTNAKAYVEVSFNESAIAYLRTPASN